MHPAFYSTRGAAGFAMVLACVLALPMVLRWTALPGRDQSFSAMPTTAGPVSMIKHLIYDDTGRADVLFVGSSLIKTDVQATRLANLLSRRFGHAMRVDILELNWYGADQQYFMLRDYLAHHQSPRLIVLHVPQVHALENRPHPQAYRWLRYGDLPPVPEMTALGRLQLYGEMVLGAPRQVLTLIRPNLLGTEEAVPPENAAIGLGSGDAAAPLPPSDGNTASRIPAASLSPASSPLFHVVVPKLNSDYRFGLTPYTPTFLKRMAELAQLKGAKLVLIHVPLGIDPLSHTIAELAPWDSLLGADIKVIAVPKDELFAGVDPTRFYYPNNNHMNPVGGERFTDSIEPAVAEAYLAAGAAESSK